MSLRLFLGAAAGVFGAAGTATSASSMVATWSNERAIAWLAAVVILSVGTFAFVGARCIVSLPLMVDSEAISAVCSATISACLRPSLSVYMLAASSTA